MSRGFAHPLAAIVVAALAVAADGSARAQSPASPQAQVARSISGQFIVQDRRPDGVSTAAAHMGTNMELVVFEPTALAVSAERLKQNLWRELGVTTEWRSRIYFALYAAQTPEDAITITSEHFRDGWQYRVELPDVSTRNGYVRAMVQVLL